jgi:pimeloyl-ACP methyl ester carboxylesterase
VKLRAAALLLALLVAGSVVGTADARTNNRKKPVIFIHGLARDSSSDCVSTWNDAKRKFRDWGHTGALVSLAYYGGDRRCDHWISHHGRHGNHHSSGHRRGNHTADTSIRHLGYHLAWTIWRHYSSRGRRVDVVAHSMGGLIIRYALAQTQRHHPDFPRYLLVEDVVTMGTPHGGARWFAVCGLLQCSQMRAGSDFLVWLERNAWEPDGRGGTDWSTFGSDDDLWVAADRAAGTGQARSPNHAYVGSCHKVWYLPWEEIGHGDFMHVTSKRITADVWRFSCRTGRWVRDFTSHFPVRRADLAVTFGNR